MNETNEVMSDALGHPLFYQTTYNVQGTPFFPDEYHAARINTARPADHNKKQDI